jgi:hypothetical protein
MLSILLLAWIRDLKQRRSKTVSLLYELFLSGSILDNAFFCSFRNYLKIYLLFVLKNLIMSSTKYLRKVILYTHNNIIVDLFIFLLFFFWLFALEKRCFWMTC